jgi:hypothetical protein
MREEVFPRFDEIVSSVPDYGAYPTLAEIEASTDDLVAAHPQVRVWPAGVSRAGQPIRCLDVPGGPMQALLVGAPHPEEPVGTLVLELLLPLLAGGLAKELGFGFSVIKVADPDGVRLNEPWFSAPTDLERFLLGAYRPALAEQSEWTFPVKYKQYGFTKPLPEAQAIMEVVHRRPLDLFMGLHNSTLSGCYFYVSAEDGELQDELAAVMAAAKLPPHCGEPEAPYLRVLGDGIFRSFSLADDYEYYETYGVDPAGALNCGTSSDAYAETVWDCFTLVAEVPCFTTAKVADATLAGISRAEAKVRGLDVERRGAAWLRERYARAAPRLTGATPWQRTVLAYLSAVNDDLRAERRQAETQGEFRREATVAEFLDSVYLRELYALTRVGQFANMVAGEPRQDGVLTGLRAEAEARVRDRAPQLASAAGIEPVPLRRLVQGQLAALLCALVAVRERYRPARSRPETPRFVAR